jgi:ABC-type phosphate transport system permease subunit
MAIIAMAIQLLLTSMKFIPFISYNDFFKSKSFRDGNPNLGYADYGILYWFDRFA